MIPLVQVLTRTETWFRERGIPSPRLDAELLMCHVLELERVQLYLSHDRPLDDSELDALRPLVHRRGQREPLAWILGHRAFHAIDLHISPGVLVPRPDTEILVEAALEWLSVDADPLYVADIGCGCGAIGLALASARNGVRLYAVDLSPEALDSTRNNVARLGLEDRVGVLQGDLLAAIPSHRPLDWVLSNPPYVTQAELDTLEPEVAQWEPRLALDGGSDGLDVYRVLIPDARQRARAGLLVEVGQGQALPVQELFRDHGFIDVRSWPDLAGIDRVVGGRIPTDVSI